MPSLKPNLVKRVERLTKPKNTSGALQPLFEAVSNAIHSTQGKFKRDVTTRGRVDLDVGPGDMIAVEDNGHGLDDVNFEAFCTTDTDNKLKAGGKGVGRLYWLDCFDRIHVQSTYATSSGLASRSFEFTLSMDDQIQNYKETPAVSGHTGMRVELRALRPNGYKQHFPKRTAYIFSTWPPTSCLPS